MCPSAPFIRDEKELSKVMQAIQKHVIDPIRIHEYFMCEVPDVVKDYFIPEIEKLCKKDKESALLLNSYKTTFEQRDWFKKNRFDLIRDDLT